MIWTLIIGGLAGWLAGRIMRGTGFGLILDILVGIAGGWLGAWLFDILGLGSAHSLIGRLIVSVIGAVVLIWVLRLLKKIAR